MSAQIPRIGEVYLLNFEGEGSVQSGFRPGVVFQNNIGNTHSPNVVVLPLTTNLKRLDLPTNVLLRAENTGLLKDSVVLCGNPKCVPKEKLGRYLTTLPSFYIGQIAAASIMASGAISYMELNAVVSVWRKARQTVSIMSRG